MRWSLSLGTVKGTVVRVHFTFLLFLAWIVLAALAEAGPEAAIGAGLFFVLLFLCVLLHEFGHILTARHFGVRTPDVTLLPIGGVARLETIPEQPRQELLIALAGPAVNLVIALVLTAFLGGLPEHPAMNLNNIGASIGLHLAFANLALATFNLIPAFPMDGGRALRALLSYRVGYARGTKVAATVGQALAIALGLFGLFTDHVMLAIVAAFVYLAAGAEAGLAHLRGATLGSLAAELMRTDLELLSQHATISQAADNLIRTGRREFLIVNDDGQLMGLLSKKGIVEGLRKGAAGVPVSEAMVRHIPTVSPRHHADEVLQLLREDVPVVAVVDQTGRPVGMVTLENLLEHVLILDARGPESANLPLRSASA